MKSLPPSSLLYICIAIFFVTSVRASYTLPGLQSLGQLETSNPEVKNLTNIDEAAAGFCREDTVSNYTQFYPQLNPQNPFENCNGPGTYQFEAINMTLMARINLISLTTTGFNAFSNESNFAGNCQAQFPNYCYFVMWYFNVQAGFRCINNGNLPNGEAIQPSCKSMCQGLLFESCPMFKTAIQLQGETDLMLCEYFANSNCFTSGDSSWVQTMSMMSMITVAILSIFLHFLLY
jgi:hypothetical protein